MPPQDLAPGLPIEMGHSSLNSQQDDEVHERADDVVEPREETELEQDITAMEASLRRMMSEDMKSGGAGGSKGLIIVPGVTTPGPTGAGGEAELYKSLFAEVPDDAIIQRMVDLCLADLRQMDGGRKRRNELGIMLKDAMGADYKKGWVNAAVADMVAKGYGTLCSDGTWFTLEPMHRANTTCSSAAGSSNSTLTSTSSTPTTSCCTSTTNCHNNISSNTYPSPHRPGPGVSTSTPRTSPAHSSAPSSASVSPSHRSLTSGHGQRRLRSGVLIIDGMTYQRLRLRVVQSMQSGDPYQAAAHDVDVNLMLQNIEQMLGVQFNRRIYIDTLHQPVFAEALRQPPFRFEVRSLPRQGASDAAYALDYEIGNALGNGRPDDMVLVITDRADCVQSLYKLGGAAIVLGSQQLPQELHPYGRALPDGTLMCLEGFMRNALIRKAPAMHPMGIARPALIRPELSTDGFHQQLHMMPTHAQHEQHVHPPPYHHQHHQHQHQQQAYSVGMSHHQHHQGMAGGHMAHVSFGDDYLQGPPTHAGTASASRPRRWCNFGARCKYTEDIAGNMAHFRRFAHVCPLDRQCRFVQNFPQIPDTEEARAHMTLFKHSCPNGQTCHMFREPDRNRRHVETFTHKAKVLANAAAAGGIVVPGSKSTTDAWGGAAQQDSRPLALGAGQKGSGASFVGLPSEAANAVWGPLTLPQLGTSLASSTATTAVSSTSSSGPVATVANIAGAINPQQAPVVPAAASSALGAATLRPTAMPWRGGMTGLPWSLGGE